MRPNRDSLLKQPESNTPTIGMIFLVHFADKLRAGYLRNPASKLAFYFVGTKISLYTIPRVVSCLYTTKQMSFTP